MKFNIIDYMVLRKHLPVLGLNVLGHRGSLPLCGSSIGYGDLLVRRKYTEIGILVRINIGYEPDFT